MIAGTLALMFLTAAVMTHYISIALSIWRSQRPPPARKPLPPVTIIRPVCGVDQYDRGTLASSFYLDHGKYELLFCCASVRDPAVQLVQELIAQYPHISAKLLIGDSISTRNPKLNNIEKGWREAAYEWGVMADSNVIMPPDYLDQLFARWDDGTGLVCSPPLGCLADGFWAELECAFLNSYQARWQSAADTIGLGFAQGKSMLWHRGTLSRDGGIEALASEIAEDAAATKLVRRRGRRVALVDRPFEQPLGRRTFSQFWHRQVRWARLRRASFAQFYAPEILTGALPALIACALAAEPLGIDASVAVGLLFAAWYLPEAELNRRASWHFTWMTPFAWMARDLLIPVVWLSGWIGNSFNWRGNEMSVAIHQEKEATGSHDALAVR